MTFAGGWSRRSFQPYRQAPTVGLDDPRVKLVDLDGDGLTDVLRSGHPAGVLVQRRRPAPGLAAHRGEQRPGARRRPGRPRGSGWPT